MTTNDIEAPPIPRWSFGDKLRKAREDAGFSTKEMARLMNVKDSSIWNWERDKSIPRDVFEVTARWARLTNVPREWLIEAPTRVARNKRFTEKRNCSSPADAA